MTADDEPTTRPDWQRPGVPEHRWPVFFALMAAVFLQRAVPLEYVVFPRWPLLFLEWLLLVVLAVINPVPLTKPARLGATATLLALAAIAGAAHWPAIAVGTLLLIGVIGVGPQRLTRLTRLGTVLTVALLAAITVDNTASALVLDYRIISGQVSNNAAVLLGSGGAVFITNIIVFGIWYWSIDLGGPLGRAGAGEGAQRWPDFLFPQTAQPGLAPPNWQPRFVDYLYVSFTNVVAFSPTDTLPLTARAKAMMAIQSIVALSTLALVIARAVNVLK